MRYILLIILLLSTQLVPASDGYQEITAEEGVLIKVKKHRSNRSLPHAFYDQAISSIPKLYPEHEYFAKRRYGRLGEVEYSIVCYKESKNLSKVLISGTAVKDIDAWYFEVYVSDNLFGDKLLIVLEAVEQLPSNKQLQPTANAPAE